MPTVVSANTNAAIIMIGILKLILIVIKSPNQRVNVI